jgi:hypothetical protein
MSFNLLEVEGISINTKNSYTNYNTYQQCYDYNGGSRIIMCNRVGLPFRFLLNFNGLAFRDIHNLLDGIKKGFDSYVGSQAVRIFMVNQVQEIPEVGLESEFIVKIGGVTYICNEEISLDESKIINEENVIYQVFRASSDGPELDIQQIKSYVCNFLSSGHTGEMRDSSSITKYWNDILDMNRLYYCSIESYSNLLKHKTAHREKIDFLRALISVFG